MKNIAETYNAKIDPSKESLRVLHKFLETGPELKVMKIFSLIEKCTGCRTCELACAFHHRKSFGRKSSSIQVRRFERKGMLEINFHEKQENGHPPCDMCANEKTPYCVRFCPAGALKVK